jgi:hypothetical protein
MPDIPEDDGESFSESLQEFICEALVPTAEDHARDRRNRKARQEMNEPLGFDDPPDDDDVAPAE